MMAESLAKGDAKSVTWSLDITHHSVPYTAVLHRYVDISVTQVHKGKLLHCYIFLVPLSHVQSIWGSSVTVEHGLS